MIDTITLDIESYYDAHTSVGKGKMTYVEYARDPAFELFGASVKVNNGETAWLRPNELRIFLQNHKDYMLIGHNLYFDGCVLDELGFSLNNSTYFDTSTAASAIYGASIASASLDWLSRKFLKESKIAGTLLNAKGKHWDELSQLEQTAMALYCCQDVELTYKLFQLLYPQMPAEELITHGLTYEMYLRPKLVLDQPLLHQTIYEADQARNKLMLDAGVLLDAEPDKALKILGSTPQFAKALSNYVIIPQKPSPSVPNKMIPALAKNDLEMQALCNSSIPEVQLLCEARLNAKSNIIKTRAERLLKDDIPLSRTYLKYAGATSSLRDSGGQKSNKQNFPRGSNLRAAICAPKGYKIMVIDSSNIELRTMFLIAGQQDKLELIRQGEDLYTHAAANIIYHISIEEITKQQRFVGKVMQLSLQYGAGWKKMQYIFAAGLMGPAVELVDSEAFRIHAAYRTNNNWVANYWNIANEMISNMAQGIEKDYPIPGTDTLLYSTEKDKLFSHSAGLYLHFKNLQEEEEGWMYDNKKGRSKIYGPMLCGRLNQHFARNIVFYQINRIAEHYPLVLRVHDEGGFLVPDNPEAIAEAETFALEQFSIAPDFAKGLPCSGEVITGTRYEKPG